MTLICKILKGSLLTKLWNSELKSKYLAQRDYFFFTNGLKPELVADKDQAE